MVPGQGGRTAAGMLVQTNEVVEEATDRQVVRKLRFVARLFLPLADRRFEGAEDAWWKAAPADRPGAGGELSYLRGRVRAKAVVLCSCAWASSEVEAALGLTVDQRQVADMKAVGTRDVGCLYTFLNSSVEVTVRQTWGSGSASAPTEIEKGVGVEQQALAGDPDGAVWRIRKGVERRLELSYTRGRVRTTVAVRGGTMRDEELQPRLLRLRRVP